MSTSELSIFTVFSFRLVLASRFARHNFSFKLELNVLRPVQVFDLFHVCLMF